MKRWLLPAVAAALFIAVSVVDANAPLFLALNKLGPATSDWLWANITVLGDGMVAFALCLPLWRRRPDLLWALAFLAVLGTLWVHGMKPVIDVARPPAVLGDQVHVIGRAYQAHSFPSGHATTAFALAGLLTLGITARAWMAALVAAASVVAISRAVVGVHWPLDILAGALGGWLCAVLAIWLGSRTRKFGERPAVQAALAVLLAACAVALVAGYPDAYPQALLLQRLIGICCLAAAAARLRRAAR
ncbi:MAG TPA: phosphatase PAP2 family protein [Burkholderiales bacterium]|nr:phosphatase PAP2 family protein [Burkholderiales bacterium]